MKFLVIVCLALAVFIVKADDNEAFKKELGENVEKCRKEFNVGDEQWKRLSSHDKTLEITDDIKCFVKCLSVANGYYKEDSLDEERILKIVTAIGYNVDKVRDHLKSCQPLYKGQSQLTCEGAYNIGQCVYVE